MDKDFDDSSGLSVIDGSSMEGGGQILRNSVSLSALLEKPVRILNIRAKRDKPGLKAQHLTGILLVKDLCCAKISGGEVHSTDLTFVPSQFSDKYSFLADIKTAGCGIHKWSRNCFFSELFGMSKDTSN